MSSTTAAVVGSAGGVGATRLSVEIGATLSRAGFDAAILDAAYATQGLSRHVSGRIEPDVTGTIVDDRPLEDALVAHPYEAEVAGRLRLAPARAPFERIATAKSPHAARGFEDHMERAADTFDYVIVDTPPIATNPGVAAVTAADRVAAVTVPTDRGVDALEQTRGRLSDIGTATDLVIGNRLPPDQSLPDADVGVTRGPVPPAGQAPAAFDAGHPLAPSLAATAEAIFRRPLDLTFERGLLETARDHLE